MKRLRYRHVAVGVVLAVCLALLVDRIALYVWGLGVRSFFRSLHHSVEVASTSGTSGKAIGEMSWGDVLFVATKDGVTDLGFMASSVRPDYARFEGHAITLWFFPPALAWTARLFPSDPGVSPELNPRPVEHYQYMLVVKGSKPVVELFLGPEHRPVPISATRPTLFP